MKTLYIDCAMGCAGDMLTAALLELHPDREVYPQDECRAEWKSSGFRRGR